MTNDRLDTALMCAARGFFVLPLCRPTHDGCSYTKHAPCPDPGKKPLTYAGVHGATDDPQKIREFWRWYPDANLGVAMGSAGGCFVLEADGPRGLAFLRRFHLGPTPTVISRRGLHFWLRIPPGYTVSTKSGVADEVDIKGQNGYVVGPGSRHRTGHVYHWHEFLSLAEVEPDYPPEPLMAWLTERGVMPRGQRAEPMYGGQRHATKPNSSGAAAGTGRSRERLQEGFKTIFTPLFKTCGTSPEKYLAEFAHKPELQSACLSWLGLADVPFDVAFLCRLPGHRERHPSAVLRRGRNGHIVYEDLHASADELPVYTLPDLYRVHLRGRALGRDEALKGPVVLPWWERLLVELGYLEPAPVLARPLPDDVPESVHRVYAGFLRLCGCKWRYELGQPTTFSVRFGMEWCGIGSHHTFREALRWLLQHGYIEELPPYRSAKGQKLTLYRPGRGGV